MITILGRELIINNMDEQYVYIQIDIENKSKKYVAVAPAEYDGAQLQLYLDAHQDEYILNILSDMYPSMGRFSSLKEFFAWREAGKIDPGTDKEAIEVDSEHKLPAHLAINPLIDEAASLADVKVILKHMMTLIA